jgi:NAD(P)-dependent dehydrogenase (short-subunit alcohol dehydrogenase family)
VPPGPNLIDTLFRLDGQAAIVTGGMGRLGSEYTRVLVAAGASVAIFDLPGRDSRLVRGLIAAGQPIATYPVNLTDREAVDRATASAAERFGPLTILINNAGLGSSPSDVSLETGPFEQCPLSAWNAMLDSHLTTALLTSQSFVAGFRRARAANATLAGSIINISSTYGMVSPDQSVYEYRRREGREYYKPVGYSVAKSGILNFTRWLAEYCAPLGIRVNTLVPGGVLEREHAPQFVAEYERRTPLGRMAREDDYNGAIVFLASPASSYMTGATLVVDGGWTAR